MEPMHFIQIAAGLGIMNVWLVRFGKPSMWRGGDAQNMREEFKVYGLPPWSLKVIGALKLLFAAGLIAGIWIPQLTRPSAIGLAVLMLGAIAMHVKVRDPLQRSLPASTMLVLSLVIAFV